VRKHRIDLSVVVPVYNSSETIIEFVKRMEIAISDSGMTCELVLTDDCSTDNSWEMITTYLSIKGMGKRFTISI